MDIHEARKKSLELLSLGLSDYKARRTLEASGCDRRTVETVMEEYTEMRQVATLRKKRLWRIAGALIFFGSGALFAYYAFFAFNDKHVFAWPLLGFATYGFLKMLLP